MAERFISEVKRYRRALTRFDKLAQRYLGFIQVVSSLLYPSSELTHTVAIICQHNLAPVSPAAPKATDPGAMPLVHLRVRHRAVFGFVQPNFLFLFRHAQPHSQIQNLEQDKPAAEAPNDCGYDARYLRH